MKPREKKTQIIHGQVFKGGGTKEIYAGFSQKKNMWKTFSVTSDGEVEITWRYYISPNFSEKLGVYTCIYCGQGVLEYEILSKDLPICWTCLSELMEEHPELKRQIVDILRPYIIARGLRHE